MCCVSGRVWSYLCVGVMPALQSAKNATVSTRIVYPITNENPWYLHEVIIITSRISKTNFHFHLCQVVPPIIPYTYNYIYSVLLYKVV